MAVASGFTFIAGTTPATPSSGKSKLYVDSTNGPSYVDDAGVVHSLKGAPGDTGPAGDDGSALTTITSSSGVVTIDCALGDNFTITLSENVTSVLLSNEPASGHAKNVCLEIIQPSGSAYTFAFPAGWAWPSGIVGVVSSVPNAVDELNLVIRNPSGSKVYRAMLTNGFS